jgi:hypothetical protein
MKNLFTAILIFVSLATYAQKDIDNITVNKVGYKASYSVGDTINIYFENNVSAQDSDSALVFWYEGGQMKYYRVNLGQSIAPVSSGWRYLAKFVVPSNFWSPGYVKIGVDKTPSFTIALTAVLSPEEVIKKDVEVNIYSITGDFIKTTQSSNIYNNLPGVYLYRSTGKESFTGKFIVL